MGMLVLPPLLGHLPDGLETLGRRGSAPEGTIEIGCSLSSNQTLAPLRATLGGPFFASHAGSITRGLPLRSRGQRASSTRRWSHEARGSNQRCRTSAQLCSLNVVAACSRQEGARGERGSLRA